MGNWNLHRFRDGFWPTARGVFCQALLLLACCASFAAMAGCASSSLTKASSSVFADANAVSGAVQSQGSVEGEGFSADDPKAVSSSYPSDDFAASSAMSGVGARPGAAAEASAGELSSGGKGGGSSLTAGAGSDDSEKVSEPITGEAIDPVFPVSREALIEADGIHDDGAYLYITDKLPELKQEGVLDGGCEIVSMVSILQAFGFDIDPVAFADEFLDYDPEGSNFSHYYSGSPHDRGMGYPPGMAKAGNAFLIGNNSQWRFANATGVDFESLVAQVEQGRPVLVWTTMYMEPPLHTDIASSGYEYYQNEHCVALFGADDNSVYVMDPLEGIVERSRERFKEIYDETGRMCLVVLNAFGADDGRGS